jgi:hypothetical protein
MEHAFQFGGHGKAADKPNIFDVAAQESTKTLLRPALLQLYHVKIRDQREL